MQPIIEVSSVADGTMADKTQPEVAAQNRMTYLKKIGCDPERSVLVRLLYEGSGYCRYRLVDEASAGDGITRKSTVVVDGLFTKQKNIALVLPLADCIGLVIRDRGNTCLGLSHLGRHNLLQQGGTRSIQYFMQTFGIDPREIMVHLTAAAGKSTYPLYDFDNRSLHEVAIEQLQVPGVPIENMTIDARDTTAESELFSHSEFLKGNQLTDGRHAIVAMLR